MICIRLGIRLGGFWDFMRMPVPDLIAVSKEVARIGKRVSNRNKNRR